MLRSTHQWKTPKMLMVMGLFGLVVHAQEGVSRNLGVHAEILYKKSKYAQAVILLDQHKDLKRNELFILGESLFHLGRFKEAQASYMELLSLGDDNKQLIDVRIFEAILKQGNLKAAIEQFNKYKTFYKIVPPIMYYSLGKTLYDRDSKDQAIALLESIPKKNEFYIRAQFLIATMTMEKGFIKKAIEIYDNIDKEVPISVEDYSVKDMAILAQARIYTDAEREDLAAAAYERVPLKGAYGEIATIELLRTLIMRSEMAFNKEGKYAQVGDATCQKVSKEALERAFKALERYRAISTIDWQKPELNGLMALLYVKSKRYDEGRLVYRKLIEHYRIIYQNLVDSVDGDSPWPIFSLNFEQSEKPVKALFPGIPDSFLLRIAEIHNLLNIKSLVEEKRRQLNNLLLYQELNGYSDQELDKAKRAQESIEKEYEALVKAHQKNINFLVAEAINSVIAEAEFRRGELAHYEMRDLTMQLESNRDFQTNKNNEFDKDLLELDKGGPL